MIKNRIILTFILVLLILFPAFIIHAEPPTPLQTGIPSCPSGSPNELCNPLTGVTSPQMLIGKIIVAVLGIVGSLALLMFIYGGFTWMTAGGNQESITKGKNILVWATIGLIIIFSSYAIVIFVFEGVGANVQ